MGNYFKKFIAPIVISVLIIAYLIGFVLLWESIPAPSFVKIIGIVIPIFFIGVIVYVLIERIKEIRGGEEDDLSKY